MKQPKMKFLWLAGLLLGLALPVMATPGSRSETSPNRPASLESGSVVVHFFICVLNTTSTGQPWGVAMSQCLPGAADSTLRGPGPRDEQLNSYSWVVHFFICVLNTTSTGQPWGVAMSQCLPDPADRIPVAPVDTMPSPGASRHPLP